MLPHTMLPHTMLQSAFPSRLRAAATQRALHSRLSQDPDTELVQKFLGSLPKKMLAQAAFNSKAYARALMYMEDHLRQHSQDLQLDLGFLQVGEGEGRGGERRGREEGGGEAGRGRKENKNEKGESNDCATYKVGFVLLMLSDTRYQEELVPLGAIPKSCLHLSLNV